MMSNAKDMVPLPILPLEMQPSIPTSSSDFIAARREKIFLADAASYSPETTDRMTFTLNSNTEMLVGKDSWVEFDLSVAVGGTLNDTAKLERWIDAGGAHALFRRMTVSLSNGTIISDVSGYNKLYSILRHNTMSENHVRYVEHVSGDGMTSGPYAPDLFGVTSSARPVTFVQANASFAQPATLTLSTGGEGRARTELSVGDIIRIETAVLNYTARVTAITNDQIVVIAGLPAVDIAANAILGVQVLKPSGLRSVRSRTATTNNLKLKIKPFSNFLQSNKFIPLMFMKSLQFTFELERGALAFALSYPSANLNPDVTISYTISNPRFIASMVTPSSDVLQAMLETYNSPEGIWIPFVDFQGDQKIVGAGAAGSMTISSSCRSARAFFFAQYNDYQEGVITPQSYVNDCISTTTKNRMTSFQVKVGSEQYPYGRPVDTDDIYNGEALPHLQKALEQHGNILYHNSMIPSDYHAINTVNGVADESRRFVGGVILARDPSSASTGVDLIQNDLILEYSRSAAGVACSFRTWIAHDRAVRLSSAGAVILS